MKQKIVSAVDAGKIIFCAAPFVKFLDTIYYFEKAGQFHNFAVGRYSYRVKEFNFKNISTLLAKKSNKITRINFGDTSDFSLLRPLFEKNNITRIEFEDSNNSGWYKDVRTHGIQEMYATFENCRTELVSFQDQFPNLKKLTLTVKHERDTDLRKILSQILPHVPALKHLELTIISDPEQDATDASYELLSDVNKLTELENFSISVYNYNLKSSESFFNQLSTSCTKLREVDFCKSLIFTCKNGILR